MVADLETRRIVQEEAQQELNNVIPNAMRGEGLLSMCGRTMPSAIVLLDKSRSTRMLRDLGGTAQQILDCDSALCHGDERSLRSLINKLEILIGLNCGQQPMPFFR